MTVGTPTTNKTWRLDVDLDTTGYTGNWAQVKGLNNLAPALENSVEDATDYDDDMWGSDAVTGRKWRLTGSALRKLYASAYDAGQEALRAAADALSLVHVRWYERQGGGDGEAYEGYALVQWEPQGGSPTGLSQVNITLLGQGARTVIANPAVTAAVPVVNSLSPATGAAAGGTNVIITGSGFTGLTLAAAVKFDTTNATEYTVVDDGRIVAKAPAHAAASVRVIVTNGTGPSVDSAGDNFVYA